MSHQDGLIDLRLSEPAGFLSGEEYFDGHLLSPPAAQPHLAVPTFPDLTDHLDLLGDGPLHLSGQERTGKERGMGLMIIIIVLIYQISNEED